MPFEFQESTGMQLPRTSTKVGPIRPSWRAWTQLLVLGSWCWGAGGLHEQFAQPAFAQEAAEAPTADQLFGSHVAPLFVSKCLTCHGGQQTEGGYSLATVEQLLKPGDSGRQPVVFGKPASSELFARITAADASERMPPDSPPLAPTEIEAVRNWLRGTSEFSGDLRLPLTRWLKNGGGPSIPRHYPRPIPLQALTVHADSGQVLVAGYGEVTVWELATGQLTHRFSVFGSHITAIQLNAAGTQLLVVSGAPGVSGAVELFEVSGVLASRSESTYTLPPPWLLCVLNEVPAAAVMSPDGTRLAIGGATGILHLVELSGAEQRASELAAHADAILDLAWSADGTRLLTASRDRTAKLFDAARSELLISYARHERAVGGVAFAGTYPLTLDESGTLRLMDGKNLENDRPLSELSGFPRRLQSLQAIQAQVLIADSNRLRSVHIQQQAVSDGQTKEGRPKTKSVVRLQELSPGLEVSPGRIQSLWSDGQRVAVGTDLGEVWHWSLGDSSQPPRRLVATP